MVGKLESGKRALESIVKACEIQQSLEPENRTNNHSVSDRRPNKVFISHKKEDQDYANALINLINFIIGPDGDKIFCSSIPGYGIKQSRDIMDEMKAQFDQNNIYLVIIHSPRYYKSAICLNEMGAGWVLGTQFSSFMTKDCTYEQLKGVIGKEKICININDESGILNAHLNEFKNDLIQFFSASSVDENKWENARGRFIKEVTSLTYKVDSGGGEDDLFEMYYIPAFDTIFSLLDVDHFSDWAYYCAIDGNTKISKQVFNNLEKIVSYIKSRPKHKNYSSFDSLMQNLALLISDFRDVFSLHMDSFREDMFSVERFYKIHPNNPHYEEDLSAYNEYVRLISDLVFELARLSNLILSRIREVKKDYKKEIGILFVDPRISEPDLIYRENEISDSPYPGIKAFIKVRLSREKHFGTKGSINPDGYEV